MSNFLNIAVLLGFVALFVAMGRATITGLVIGDHSIGDRVLGTGLAAIFLAIASYAGYSTLHLDATAHGNAPQIESSLAIMATYR